MGKYAANERTLRRREARAWAEYKARLYASPGYRRFKRNEKRRRWPLASPAELRFFCWLAGVQKGGKPKHAGQRCTKRLGRRLCGNWRIGGTDRCHRHPRKGQFQQK